MSVLLPDSDSEDELPPCWEERATLEGHVFYVNHATQATRWKHPRTGKQKVVSRELPFGWEKRVEDDGKVLFIDHENNRSTYTDPRLAFAVEVTTNHDTVRQRFDASTNALQILHGRDLSGKTAVITGANSGIGYETAFSLARHGMRIIMACRNVSAAETAIENIKKVKPDAGSRCSVLQVDLTSLQSVKNFSEKLKAETKSVDLLILNAGVCFVPYTKTEDDLEMTFQVNHLSQFYLTLLVEPLLVETSRVVILSSESHRFSSYTEEITPELLSPPQNKYWSMSAYNNSKLCNVLFAKELSDRLFLTRGINVFAVHPGNMVSSNISKNWWLMRFLFAIVRPFTKSLQQAASTTVYAGASHDMALYSGLYLNNCYVCTPSAASLRKKLIKQLWDISINMIKERLGPDSIPGY